jgi:hypothetical protein
VAAADVDGDGQAEIITGAGPSGGPHIRIFDRFGRLLYQFFAYDKRFRGGVSVAAADVDGDGQAEIITGAGPGGGPHIRVFDRFGRLLYQFFAYDKKFRGGVSVAAADVDSDGQAEIITGAGPSGGPHIRIFDRFGRVEQQFFAFEPTFRGGLNLTSCNLFGSQPQIIIAPLTQMEPVIKIFNSQGVVLGQFLSFEKIGLRGATLNCLKIQ